MSRHTNGGGRIYDDAEISTLAYFDRASVARAHTKIRSGHFFNSAILGSTLCAGDVDITDSTLDCHSVAGQAVVLRCQLGRGVEVYDRAKLSDVTLVGDVKVYGDAQLIGQWSLSTGYGARVHAGVWERPPRVHKFLRFPVNECAPGRVHVGCRCRTIEEWLEHYPEVARRMKWSPEEVKELISVLEAWGSPTQ